MEVNRQVTRTETDNRMGWVIAIVLLLLLLAGIWWWMASGQSNNTNTTPPTDTNSRQNYDNSNNTNTTNNTSETQTAKAIDNLAQVKVGDTQATVESMAGSLSPDCTDGQMVNGQTQEVCTYTDGSKSVKVTYTDGKVSAVSKTGF